MILGFLCLCALQRVLDVVTEVVFDAGSRFKGLPYLDIRIKWPSDLYLNGLKVGSICIGQRSSMSVIPTIMRAQSSHPLNPLSAAEISVAVATVRAAGSTPEVRDSMRFIEVVLSDPEKHVVALADAYFFPPFQPSLLPRTKGVTGFPGKLPPRCARLIVYNRKSNETSIWIVELSEVHAATRGGHHRGKVISSQVVPDVQPPMDAVEYAECEAVDKDFPPFREAMKKRGIEDLDLVMVDPWCAGYHSNLWKTNTSE